MKTIIKFIFFFFLLSFHTLSAQKIDSTNVVWVKFDVDPEFPGGNRALDAYWKNNFRPQKFKAEGEGKVEFTINANGTISNIFIAKALSPEADRAAIDAISKMPRWKPAVYKGQPTNAQYSISYWQEKTNIWTGQSENIDLPEPDMVKPNGWAFGLWIGGVNRGGDFSEYFKPVRLTLGLHIGYRIKRFQFGFEYDVVAVSRFKKPLLADRVVYVPDNELIFGNLNLYFPLAYTIIQTDKWSVSPYIAPTLNTFDIKKVGNGTTYEDFSSFSYTLGLNMDYTANKAAAYYGKNRNKKTLVTTCVRGRFYVNPMNIVKPNSAPLKGTAIGFSLGIQGFMNKEK